GAGYGGSCFPKDVKALIHTAQTIDYAPEMLQAVERRNETQRRVLFERIAAYYGGADKLQGKVIALWGLAFKPETDDMRQAPSCTLMELLWQAGARVQAHDPVAMNEARRLYPNRVQGDPSALTLCDSPLAALQGADALAIVTEWKAFRVPDFVGIAGLLRDCIIFDGRNLYDPKTVARHGLTYVSIGREMVKGVAPEIEHEAGIEP
ncbi:MAG: UDP-glucose 6-dehydrogenase, partial [Burkholderiaceae bacterium]|nr:UDP-glucose 6-dehydrogenase [Burkholderiaceae bacterium]